MQKIRKFSIIALCAGLVGCGDTIEEQALYGAGAGYLGSYIVNGNPFIGAAAGAAANVLYCRNGPGNCG